MKRLVIGRHPSADIYIRSDYLSSKHAEITLIDPQTLTFSIKDLDSTNGTFINGERITGGTFGFGDVVTLGAYRIEALDFLGHFVQVKENSSKSTFFTQSLALKLVGLCIALLFVISGFSLLVTPEYFLALLATFTLIMLSIKISIEVANAIHRRASQKLFFQSKVDELASISKKYKQELDFQKKAEKYVWQGFRKFKIASKVQENNSITSFYLQPHDGQPIPTFKPGQYLTFKLNLGGEQKPLTRCYSLSCGPNSDYYRVSIKRVPPSKPELPPGRGSNYFHDSLHPGDIIDVKNPSGGFFLDTEKPHPTVLLAGGIGITPMLSMLETLVELEATQPIWLFYGVRNQDELIKFKHIQSLTSKYDNVNLCICFSKPKESDVFGVNYHHNGRVSVSLFKEKLGSNNFKFYLCGPGPFMSTLTDDLIAWGVPKEDVHGEAFGPSSVKKTPPKGEQKQVEIEFKKSGKKVKGSDGESILEIAESAGIELDYGCRAGSCGTCETAVVSGEVHYDDEVDYEVSPGCCLTCMASPKHSLVIDA